MEKDNKLRKALTKSLQGYSVKDITIEAVENIQVLDVYRYIDDTKRQLVYLDESVYEKGDGGSYSARIRGMKKSVDGLKEIENYSIENSQFTITDYKDGVFSVQLEPIYNLSK